ncbi:MAG TPA: hypothetical protein VLV78_12190 [Thermoanaerobaculia bacterium]|nr:hypothetical protein [Thermoanaerobaculia bacterium]
MTPERFSIVTRDEVWSLDRRAALESRLLHGTAHQRGNAIDARDDCDDELREACEAESDRVREALTHLPEGRARVVVSARRSGEAISLSATISITLVDLSIVTVAPHLASDYEMLVEVSSVRPEATADARTLPVVWRHGAAAVLLHEAAGHAAEHGHAPLNWPEWLTTVDESDDGSADLLAGEPPRAFRRQSFSDVPLRRMTNVVAGNRFGEVALPPRRIEILLVAGGRYEPLTELVTLSISAADLVDGDRSVRLRPFSITRSRSEVAASLRGAVGGVRRYPGVICSREGQELFVGSYAPDVLTEFR